AGGVAPAANMPSAVASGAQNGGVAVDGRSAVETDGAVASDGWMEKYFWPLAVLVLAFMAIVLAVVFRKRSTPVTEVQGVRRPAAARPPAGQSVWPAADASPSGASGTAQHGTSQS